MYLLTSGPRPGNDDEWVEKVDVGPDVTTSWGSQLDLSVVPSPPVEEILELDHEEEDEVISELLVSEDDDNDDEIFIPSTQT